MNIIRIFVRKEFFLLILLLIYLIDPFLKGIYVFYFLMLFLLTKLSFLNYKLDGKGFLLLLFSIFYALFYTINPVGGTQLIIIYALAPFTFYIVGRYFSMNYSSTTFLYLLFLFIAIGFSFIPAISIIKHILENGFVGTRNQSLIWDNNYVIAATLLGAHFTLNMSSLGVLFVQKTNSFERRIKRVILAVLFISLFCILRVASRTQILITLITFVISIFYLIPKLSLKRKISLLLTIFISVILFLLFYSISSDSSIFNTFNERKEDTEYIMSGSGRTNIWAMSIGNVFSRPYGWSDSEVGHAHNLWLDVSRLAGILPFLTLCVFTFLCISLIYNIIKSSPENHFFNILILSYFIGFMAVFFVEPVMEGLFTFFLIYCLFIGILSGYADNRNFRIQRVLMTPMLNIN